MRLFVAIDLPPDSISALDRLIQGLRPSARIAWCRADNLHLTTKFIGEWPDSRLRDMEDTLRAVPRRDAIPIAVRGLGFFPNAKSPRVFWAGVEAPPSLAELVRETELALRPLGIEPEKRAYSPHLTLARIKEPVPLESLRKEIAALPPAEFGAFTADRFYLYRSTLRPSGSVYTKLSEFPFAA